MPIIADAEREYLLDSMRELLDEYDYDYSDHALNKIIDTWYDQKRELIAAFKNHPNYIDGKFMIAFDQNYERVADLDVVNEFSRWLDRCCMTSKEFYDNLPAEVIAKRNEQCCIWLTRRIYDLLYHLGRYSDRTISPETAEHINDELPAVHAHAGQKTSRVINKICTYLGYAKHPDYNKEFAKYADALNPMVIKRHTVLSVNPLDYLTMSFGNSWASCHTIDKQNKRNMPNSYEGQYSSGTMSYMLDETSMVFYTVEAEYDGNDYWTQPKINRQMFHYGEEKLIQGRLYPQKCDGCNDMYTPYRNIVQEIIATIFGFPNLWTISRGSSAASRFIESRGTHYTDYTCFESCTLSRVQGSTNDEDITVGARPICISCGYEHSISESIDCCYDGSYEYCADCGCRLSDDDVIWVDGEAYCSDCVHYCERCEEYHRMEEYWIASEDRYVCEWCATHRYTVCDECGEYFDNDEVRYVDSTERHVCDDCLDENYTYCDECEEYHLNENVEEVNGRYLCKNCQAEEDCEKEQTDE